MGWLKAHMTWFSALMSAITFIAICSIIAMYFRGTGSGSVPPDGIPIVKWDTLDKLDYQTGFSPPEVSNLNDKRVRLPGFVVPLEDKYWNVSEFLLVPDAGSCIHVPPPPPNQMVYVKMKNGRELQMNGRAIWVTGILKVSKVASPYGPVAYSIEGEEGVEFKGWKQFDKVSN